MISIAPKADSSTGRVLSLLSRLLGLRSETVYSRTILLVALVQFIVLGLAVVAVWLAVSAQFRHADEQELLAAARRVESYFASQSGISPQLLAARASSLIGRRVFIRDGVGDADPGLRLVRSHRPVPDAVFRVSPADRASPEVVVAGAVSFYDTGLLAARVFVVGLALAGGLMLLVMLFVVDRTIVGRIQLLTEKVEREKSAEQLPVKLDYPGDDELAMLARSIEELASQVQKAEREYREVVEDLTESICRFDGRGRVIFSNKAFDALCVTSPSGAAPLLSSCLGSGVRTAVEQALADCTAAVPIAHFTHAGPGDRWYRSSLHANFDAGGRRGETQWISADVTKELTAQRKLQDSQAQLARLSARLITSQDEERRRLARELHDSTAQSLSALEINLSALVSTSDPADAKRLAREAAAISRQVCDELRTMSYLLHPPLLEEAGLAFAIRWFAEGFAKRNGIPVNIDVPENFPRMPAEIETALFRVVQESLSNIYRHAGASKAWIALSRDEDGMIALEIRDNGEGLPDDFSLARSSGVGLAGMRERMRELGGTLEIESSEYGVAVKCRLRDTATAENAEDTERGELFGHQ